VPRRAERIRPSEEFTSTRLWSSAPVDVNVSTRPGAEPPRSTRQTEAPRRGASLAASLHKAAAPDGRLRLDLGQNLTIQAIYRTPRYPIISRGIDIPLRPRGGSVRDRWTHSAKTATAPGKSPVCLARPGHRTCLPGSGSTRNCNKVSARNVSLDLVRRLQRVRWAMARQDRDLVGTESQPTEACVPRARRERRPKPFQLQGDEK